MRFSIGSLLILAFLCFSGILFNSEETYAASRLHGLEIIKSNTSELILKYTPEFLGFDTLTTLEGKEALLPIIGGTEIQSGLPGSPVSLSFINNVTIPSPDGFEIEISRIGSIKSIHSAIAPTEELERINDLPSSVYSINEMLYRNYTTPDWIKFNYAGISRFGYAARLEITAARYNPQTHSIEIPEYVYIKIKFRAKEGGTPISYDIKSYNVSSSINERETGTWDFLPPITAPGQVTDKKNQTLGESTGQWLKIAIETEGIYKIDADMLSGAGASIPKEEILTIKIYGNGGAELSERVTDGLNNIMHEQEIIVTTKSNGDLESIIFYGSPAYGFILDSNGEFHHYINHYSNTNYYLLTWGGSPGKRAQLLPVPPGDVVNKPNTYIQNLFFEEEINPAFKNPSSGRVWFGRNLLPATFTNLLPNLERSDTITYNISVAHRADSPGTFSIYESTQEIMQINLQGINLKSYEDAYTKMQTCRKPASMISNDRSVLKFNYTNPGSGTAAIPFFDWYEIHYPRSFAPIDNEIGFYSKFDISGITEYIINGYSAGSTMYGFDVTERNNPHQLSNTAVTGGMFIFRSELEAQKPHRYFISSNIKKPHLEKASFADLRAIWANADVIVITHPSLESSAKKYADYRSRQSGMSVTIVLTEQIYNEFGSGIADPTAIRDFIAYAFANWNTKPRYVVLWGDGHYDYKNIETKKVNLLPPYESADNVDTFYAVNSYTSDDFFAKVAGDDELIDISIGRLPINTEAQGQWLVDKIDKYENYSSEDSWRTQFTLAADDSWSGKDINEGEGTLHTGQSETLSRAHIPSEYQQKKIYLPEYPTENVPGGRRKPRATQDLVSTTNNYGNLLLNWIGHGNPRVLAHEELYERSTTTPLLINLDKLFFLTAATCDFGRFDMTDANSGAEELILSKLGGAIGILASARVVLSYDNAAFNNKFYDLLLERDEATGKYPSLGDALFAVKQVYNKLNDVKFLLLGDPSLTLLIPENIVSIDSINGTYVGDGETVNIKALSNVKISGIIKNPITKLIDESFDGTVILTTLDCDINLKVKDIDGTIHSITKQGGALNRSSYKVENGSFTANFIIPKDISFSNAQGRIFAYAYSNDKRYAKGASTAIVIGGIDTVQYSDSQGPDLKIYLDSKAFKSGDYVSPIPLLIVDLFDSSGINTTGLGIGHRIEAWLDDDPNSIDLNGKFKTSLEDSRSGIVEESLFDLNPGLHHVKVRAWDVFNNFSIAEADFRIADNSQGIIITELINYPNPFYDNTTFKFKHNITPPFDIEISIFNSLGQKLKTLNANGISLHLVEIPWDGRNANGIEIPNGAYSYRLTIRSSDGLVRNAGGMLVINR